MTGPLDGVRVLDLTRLVAGNQLTVMLGDLGADVVKVESPGRGDPLRAWQIEGESLWWQVYGRNKRSVALDLRDDADRDAVRRLAVDAHVLVESFRPGRLEAIGLAPSSLREDNPALVVVRVSGWGQTGAYADRPGFGTLVEAMSGYAVMAGYEDGEPLLPPTALADMVTGTYGAFAAVTALRHAERTGVGQDVDLSLFEGLFSVLGPTAAAYEATGRAPVRSGNRSRTTAPRNTYRCQDGGYLALSASIQGMCERLLTAIGRADLIDDPRFHDNAARLAHVEELDAILGEHFARATLAENLDLLVAAEVTVAPVAYAGDLLDGEFFTSRGVVVRDERGTAMHAVVPRLSETPGAVSRAAPEVGEHSAEVLDALQERES